MRQLCGYRGRESDTVRRSQFNRWAAQRGDGRIDQVQPAVIGKGKRSAVRRERTIDLGTIAMVGRKPGDEFAIASGPETHRT